MWGACTPRATSQTKQPSSELDGCGEFLVEELFLPAGQTDQASETHAAEGQRGGFGDNGQIANRAQAVPHGAQIAVNADFRSNAATSIESDRLTLMLDAAGINVAKVKHISGNPLNIERADTGGRHTVDDVGTGDKSSADVTVVANGRLAGPDTDTRPVESSAGSGHGIAAGDGKTNILRLTGGWLRHAYLQSVANDKRGTKSGDGGQIQGLFGKGSASNIIGRQTRATLSEGDTVSRTTGTIVDQVCSIADPAVSIQGINDLSLRRHSR